MSLLERMLQGVWRYRLLCLLLIIAAMVTTSALMHPGKMQSATALIALNYEEATRGLYPNQTRFNISLLKSDEVLSRALEKAGVTNMESLALAEHISVSASSVGGMSIDSGSATGSAAGSLVATAVSAGKGSTSSAALFMTSLMSAGSTCSACRQLVNSMTAHSAAAIKPNILCCIGFLRNFSLFSIFLISV